MPHYGRQTRCEHLLFGEEVKQMVYCWFTWLFLFVYLLTVFSSVTVVRGMGMFDHAFVLVYVFMLF